ncbi:hypothetical protein Taro_013018, partial [Colocasia esculenta]|nr:hypothetical protein [Colocasia esculenta]
MFCSFGSVDYAVVEKPTLETWMQGGLDYIMLKNLNIDGIRTIGSVLGQSIALDYYIRQVDGMVAEFTDINRGMEKTGTFTMKRKKLFQLVGKANSNLADVILKLGLFERSDIAWKHANYAQIWEYLRDEYELTQRFGSLDFKLKFVEHNIRFLQEILQNRKSNFLEWLIIILIGVEILISVYNNVRFAPVFSPLFTPFCGVRTLCPLVPTPFHANHTPSPPLVFAFVLRPTSPATVGNPLPWNRHRQSLPFTHPVSLVPHTLSSTGVGLPPATTGNLLPWNRHRPSLLQNLLCSHASYLTDDRESSAHGLPTWVFFPRAPYLALGFMPLHSHLSIDNA